MKLITSILCSVLLAVALPADEIEETLKVLCEAHAVSGFEGPVRNILKQYWSDLPFSIQTDGIGNLIGTYSASNGSGPKIMIMAHMDEVGFLTSKVSDKGYISAVPLGGWLDHVMWGQKWNIQVGERSVPAISGIDSVHVLADYTKIPSVSKNQFFLDTGLSKEELDALSIRPGLPVTPVSEFTVLKEGKRYSCKAFDDRAGLAVMLEVMRTLSKHQDIMRGCRVMFAATVQEELGMRGAKTVYKSLKPDIVINLECGIARDHPVQLTVDNEPILGGGPTIFVFDGSMIPNPKLVSEFERVAKLKEIAIQWESEGTYGQDGASLQVSGQGVPVVNIGIPIRYVHSHWGVMDRSDFDDTVKLLLAVIENFDVSFMERLRDDTIYNP